MIDQKISNISIIPIQIDFTIAFGMMIANVGILSCSEYVSQFFLIFGLKQLNLGILFFLDIVNFVSIFVVSDKIWIVAVLWLLELYTLAFDC